MRPLLLRNSFILLVFCLSLSAGSASAGDLSVSGQLSMAGGTADTSGSVDLGPSVPPFSNSGDDSDSSPVFGGAFGYGFLLSEMFPYEWNWKLPNWTLRFDLEAQGGRDYEFVTTGPDPYLSEVSNWTLMQNIWMDLPVDTPVRWAMGRVPMLDPVTFNFGAGVGLGGTEISTTNYTLSGGTTNYHFVWQVGAGLGYRVTDQVSLNLGYRYVDLGEHSFDLGAPPNTFGNIGFDLASHELALGFRVAFFRTASPGEWSVRRRRGR